jgi:hypothetical protein
VQGFPYGRPTEFDGIVSRAGRGWLELQ